MYLKISNSLIITFLVLLLMLLSCESNTEIQSVLLTDSCESVVPTPNSLRYVSAYGKPLMVFPNKSDNSIFYSDEVVEIKWELSDDLLNSELQIIEFENAYSCPDYNAFHLLDNIPSAGYGNQFVHYFQLNQFSGTITDSVSVALIL